MTQLTLEDHLKMGNTLSAMYTEMGELMRRLGTTLGSSSATYQTAKRLDIQLEALQNELHAQFKANMDIEDIQGAGRIYHQGKA